MDATVLAIGWHGWHMSDVKSTMAMPKASLFFFDFPCCFYVVFVYALCCSCEIEKRAHHNDP